MPGERASSCTRALHEQIQDGIEDLLSVDTLLGHLADGDGEAFRMGGGMDDARRRLANLRALCDELQKALSGPRVVED
ncbi:MAG: hypothetical protein IPM35_10185 [Myxococcales bacterium]|nr:hypothetical protein [Myxococcales bacterium]